MSNRLASLVDVIIPMTTLPGFKYSSVIMGPSPSNRLAKQFAFKLGALFSLAVLILFEGCGSSSSSGPAPVTPPPSTTAQTTVYTLGIGGNDIVWDAQRQRFYISVSSSDQSYANSIVTVDPVTGKTTGSQPMRDGANALAISDDSQYLYVGTNITSSIQRLTLPALSADIEMPLPTTYVGAGTAASIQVAPGNPHRIAVAEGSLMANVGDNFGILLFDDGTQRGGLAGSAPLGPFFSDFTWGADDSTIYTYSSSSLLTLDASRSGLSVTSTSAPILPPNNFFLPQYSAQTDLIYSFLGGVVDPKTASMVGVARPDIAGGEFIEGEACGIADPALNRLFVAGRMNSDPTSSTISIEAFDLTTYRYLGSIQLPNVVPPVQRLVRWGRAGLALITQTVPRGAQSDVYIIDGAFVSPSAAPDETRGRKNNPEPIISSITPGSATAGSSPVNLTILGSGFTPNETVVLNGYQPVTTTFVSSTQLNAQLSIPASPSLDVLTVADLSDPTIVSNGASFSTIGKLPAGVTLNAFSISGRGVVWNQNTQKLYVSIAPWSVTNGNSILEMDPASLTIGAVHPVHGSPGTMRISDDGQYLYTDLGHLGRIARFILPSFTSDISWPLGTDPQFGLYFALDLQVAPGQAHTTAVSLGSYDSVPTSIGGVRIFDDSAARPQSVAGSSQPGGGLFDSLQWGDNADSVYAGDMETTDGDFYQLSVNSSGVSILKDQPNILYFGQRIHFDHVTGHIYSDGGQVIDPASNKLLGSFGADGLCVVDSAQHRVYFLGQTADQTGTESFTIEAFDQQSMQSIGSLTLPKIGLYPPFDFIRSGTNGFAILAPGYLDYNAPPGMLYILNGDFVGAQSRAQRTAHHVHRTWGNGFLTPSGKTASRRPLSR